MSIQQLVNQLFSTSTIKDATSSTDSGIQLGSESLSSCDTPIGDSTTDTGDSDCENDGDASNSARKVVEARKGYVRRVSSVRVQELGESLHRLIQNSKMTHAIDPLFECLLVVGLDRDPNTGIYHPYIREKFPRDAKLAEGVEQFCFPDSLEWPCHEGSTAQFYTLAITDQRGGRKYGCCFRILPEGATFCIPITYCIISSHRAIGFYREILREITASHGHNEYQRRHLLQELYKKSFPAPGSSISITEPTIEETYVSNEHVGYGSLTGTSPKAVTIRRRADHRLDEGDLVTLVSTVDLSIVIKLFGSLLLERKVVLLSRALSTLSLCVEALESLLYPFSWQHTFVPILPLDMTDVIDAPAPFLIGVLRSSRTAWDKTLDDGIVVDLDVDHGKIISCVGDEGTILPKRIHRKLRNALSQLVLDLAGQKESTRNVLVSECFIRMFVETLGHYSNHIVTKQDGTRAFDRESFVKSAESKATQNFLEWFSETSMFNEFIEMKLKNCHQHGLFEQRIIEQMDNGPMLHGNGNGTPKKDIWVKMKGPFGTWLKETFKQS
ncbi:Suppression of tumorigenicity 5 protein [Orchesella cincta]|uniref:Suppression of tumorigenicity 5 protein n=1 Tax=Orchesella cincta TaxID=48709 RepID=A0A1D2MZ16_ORCCI|nr:Suppression of tumorigenicity 5 protein [Orchesella cincta]